MRLDRPAAVHIGVDERRQPARGLDHLIQVEPDLAQHVEVRPEAGRVHDDVGAESLEPSKSVADDDGTVAVALQPHDLELIAYLHDAEVDEFAHLRAQAGAIGELVALGGEDAHRAGVADDPGDPGLGVLPNESGEVDESVRGRVPRTDDRDVLAEEPLALRAGERRAARG